MKKLTLILFTAILYLIGCKANPTDSITNGDNGKNAGNSGNNGGNGGLIPIDKLFIPQYYYADIIYKQHPAIIEVFILDKDKFDVKINGKSKQITNYIDNYFLDDGFANYKGICFYCDDGEEVKLEKFIDGYYNMEVESYGYRTMGKAIKKQYEGEYYPRILGAEYHYKVYREYISGHGYKLDDLSISNDYSVHFFDNESPDIRTGKDIDGWDFYEATYENKVLTFTCRPRSSYGRFSQKYEFNFNTGKYKYIYYGEGYDKILELGTIFNGNYEIASHNIYTNESQWLLIEGKGNYNIYINSAKKYITNHYVLIWFDCNYTNQSIYLYEAFVNPYDKYIITNYSLITNQYVKNISKKLWTFTSKNGDNYSVQGLDSYKPIVQKTIPKTNTYGNILKVVVDYTNYITNITRDNYGSTYINIGYPDIYPSQKYNVVTWKGFKPTHAEDFKEIKKFR